jgi:hypothetical protein
MTDLQQQILARIDATPYRPPTIADFTGERASVSWSLAELMAAGVIDTATGDSGTTYTRRKVHTDAPYSSPHAPKPTLQIAHAGLAYFPSRSPAAQPVWHGPENTPSQRATIRACTVPRLQTKAELAAQARAHKAAERAKEKAVKPEKKTAIKQDTALKSAPAPRPGKHHGLVMQHLTWPMSAAEFAAAAGVTKDAASSMLGNREKSGTVKSCPLGLPKMYYRDASKPEIEAARARAAKFKWRALRAKKLDESSAAIVADYEAGKSLKKLARELKLHKDTIGKIIGIHGVKKRTRSEAQNLWRAQQENKPTRHRRIDAFAGRAEL